jgi:hypothetical protein
MMELEEALDDADGDEEETAEAWEDFDDLFTSDFRLSCDILRKACEESAKRSKLRNERLNTVLIWE